jgi:glycosyltransferase involved in cell wall biosynthesis
MPRAPWPVLLLIRELDYGGTERQMTEIVKALDWSRFKPHAAAFIGEGLCANELRALGIPLTVFPVRSLASPAIFAEARRFAGYVRAHGIRLVHTWDVPANLFGVFAARAAGVPLVLASQRAYRGLTPGLARHLLRITDRTVDGIVVNCEAMRRHLVDDERVPPGMVHVCPNSIDTDKFRPGPRPALPGLEGAPLVVGAACVLRPEKGLPTLVDAFARVRRPGMKLLLIGNGPSESSLREQARDLGIESDCVFLPPVGDIERWLPAFDIFVLPSLSEALSNSIMEAMASGCCAIASRVGGNPELVRHNETGLLFRPGDAAGLAAQLERVIAGPALRARLGARAREWMCARFSRRAAVECIERVYESFLG